MFYIGIQHCRTLAAEAEHKERSEQAAKSILRTQAELEGNEQMLSALEHVRIKRTNAVSEVLGYRHSPGLASGSLRLPTP